MPLLFALAAVWITLVGAGGPPKIGDRAPDLAIERLLQAPEGVKATWESLKGKVVLLEFWATWCGPCVASIPHINELADKFKGQPVQFIAISHESPEVIEAFLKRKPIHAWVGLDLKRQTGNSYAVRGIPHTVIVDKQGTIVGIMHPSELTEQVLRDLVDGRQPSLPKPAPFVDIPSGDESRPLYQVLIRKVPTPTNGTTTSSGPGMLMISAEPAISLLGRAYDLPETRLVAETKLPEGCYSVDIQIPRREADAARIRLREALEASLSLHVIREARELNVLVLTVATGAGQKLTPTVTSGQSMSAYGSGINATSIDANGLASCFETQLHKPVINETKLTGRYDVQLRWTEGDEKSLIDAAESQLGLRLVPEKRTIEVGVIRAIPAELHERGASAPAANQQSAGKRD